MPVRSSRDLLGDDRHRDAGAGRSALTPRAEDQYRQAVGLGPAVERAFVEGRVLSGRPGRFARTSSRSHQSVGDTAMWSSNCSGASNSVSTTNSPASESSMAATLPLGRRSKVEAGAAWTPGPWTGRLRPGLTARAPLR